MTDLLAAVITLDPLRPGELDPFQGRAMHALCLDLVRQADPAAAARLHDSDGLKPFTSSNLIGLRPPAAARCVAVQPGSLLRWRITTFDPALTALWLDRVLPSLPATLTVGDLELAVRGCTTDPAADPAAGLSSYAALVQRHTLGPRHPAPWINLRFTSPTTFHSQGVHVPLPIPGLMLSHWLEKWNAFAPLTLDPDVRRVAEQEVVVNRYDLHTEPVQFGPAAGHAAATLIGFTGQCSLAIRNSRARADEDSPAAEYWRRIPHLLAAYSFWAGTGHRTPYGLGQTRPQAR